MRRWIAVLMTVVMVMSSLPITAFAAKMPAEGYGYYYDHLTDPLAKRVYTAIEKSQNHQKVTIDIPELEKYDSTNAAQMSAAFEALNPRIQQGVWCWRYDHILESDLYANGIECRLEVQDRRMPSGKVVKSRKVTVAMPSHPFYRVGMEAQRDAKIDLIVNEAQKQPTVFAKLRFVHDRISRMGTYNYAAATWDEGDAEKEGFFYAHSSLGILLRGTGVCESYAKIFKMVCDKLGLGECICLVSKSHMWNAVKIDGKWYGVDVTWNDRASDKEPIHTYFLSGDPDVLDGAKTDHVVDTTYTVAPVYATAPYRPLDSTVYMAAPAVTAVNINSGVEMKWGAVAKAKKYQVLRSDREGNVWGKWKVLRSNLTGTSYTDKTVVNGGKYQYAVKAQNDFCSSEIQPVEITRLSTPARGVSNTVGGIKVTWSANAAADGYYVYRAQCVNGKWTALNVVANTKSATYVDKQVSVGTDYRYTVRSYKGTSLSHYNISGVIRRLTAPKVTVKNDAKSVTVSWRSVKGAQGYYVYRSEQKGNKWTAWAKMATAKGLTYTDKKAQNGVKYRYNVRAYNSGVTGPDTTSASITRLTASSVKVSKVSKGIKVTWSKNKSASGYYLYRREYKKGKWGSWVKLGSTKKTAYTDRKAKKKVYYQYCIRVIKGSSISVSATSKKIKR